MKPDASNLKKRKLLAAAAEDLGLPATKHLCCKTAEGFECESFFPRYVNEDDVEVLDMLIESTKDRNSFPGESQSSIEVIDAGFQKMDSYNEASTSWADSRSITSGSDFIPLQSKILSVRGDDLKEYHFPHQDDTGWHDFDCLEETIGTNYVKDTKQQAADQLEGFLSSSGMLSSDKWFANQETQIGRHKPTIDQEFEQYFSTLML